MPKEITYGDSPEYMLREDGNEVLASEQPPGGGQAVLQRGVHIGWSRNKYVEIGVGPFMIATNESAGAQYASFDRDGLNRIIRSLRKARDQAYGQDA